MSNYTAVKSDLVQNCDKKWQTRKFDHLHIHSPRTVLPIYMRVFANTWCWLPQPPTPLFEGPAVGTMRLTRQVETRKRLRDPHSDNVLMTSPWWNDGISIPQPVWLSPQQPQLFSSFFLFSSHITRFFSSRQLKSREGPVLSKLLINNAGGVARPRLRKMAFGSCSGDNYSCRSDYTTEGLLGLIITCIFRPGREYRTPCADDEEIQQYVCIRLHLLRRRCLRNV